MKYAVLILRAGDTDESPRNEHVIEAKNRVEAIAAGKRRCKFFIDNMPARIARVRRLSPRELAARYADYEGYMNGGYLKYFNPFTGYGYLD